MSEKIMPRNEVMLRILKTADELMAQEGLHHLSTHKIAKGAGVSVGTIYLYFKDKETLLNELIWYLFELYQQYLNSKYDPLKPLFEQYQTLWRATWQFGQENPNVIQNIRQYESLPGYRDLMASCMNNEALAWNKFVLLGQSKGVIINLDRYILFALTMNTPWEIMRLQMALSEQYSEELIDEIILRTWKAITV